MLGPAEHALCLIGLVVLVLVCAPAQTAERRAPLTPVPSTDVKLTDRFWAPRLEIDRTVTLPHNLRMCEETGRIANFEIAAGLRQGQFEGIYFNDSDVYKVVEGAAYLLALHPDPKRDETLDALIAKIAAAQQPDGYLNSYFTLVEPNNRWKEPHKHELYCAGHLIEAGVAHYRATGKRSLLEVAIRVADNIDHVFGDDRLIGVPEHEETELALVKLYEATGEERYLKLAQWFIDQRGHGGPEYAQDHIPVREQTEVVGHAVRAMYLYCGVADIARQTGEEALLGMLDRVWADLTQHKLYVTGGIGPSSHNEGFTTAYDLPNDTSYAETCAGIGLALWSHRMALLHGRRECADVLEQVLYNGMISGVSLSGDRFFYVNPLASRGNHHRAPWFGCACCPPNVLRIIPQVGGMVYATSPEGVWVNLYAGSQASVKLETGKVELIQETDYPWFGAVKLTVNPGRPRAFGINLRIPGWCEGATARVNEQSVDSTPGDNGYLRLHREWQQGDVIRLNLPMPPQRVAANPGVAADVGRVALRRGPVVYCLEAADNGRSVRDLALPREARIEARLDSGLLGGVMVLHARGVRRAPVDWEGVLYQPVAEDQPTTLTAVPYYAWDNRAPGEMTVWIPECPALADLKLPRTVAQDGEPAASFVHDDLRAINDGIAPRGSGDLSVPRFTWWDHKGGTEWVSLSFAEPQRISCAEVYWFDDGPNGGCRVPQSWEVQWLDGSEWRPVTGASSYRVAKDTFNRVTFDPVETKGIRLVAQLPEGMSGGVLEWRLPQ